MPRKKGVQGLVHLYKNSFTLTETKCKQISARVTGDLALVNCQKCLKAVEVPVFEREIPRRRDAPWPHFKR